MYEKDFDVEMPKQIKYEEGEVNEDHSMMRLLRYLTTVEDIHLLV